MLKRIVLTIICLFLLGNIVFAHGGSTDEDGGHTDRSTGDYHYHHGYPAHDHEDLDGDGDIDCPYDFDDQTDHSHKSASSQKESSPYIKDTRTDEKQSAKADQAAKGDQKAGIKEAVELGVGICLFMLFLSLYLYPMIAPFFQKNKE